VKRTVGTLIAVSGLLLGLTGCVELMVASGVAAGAAAAGTSVAYYMSAVDEIIGAPLPEVREATSDVLQTVSDGVVEARGDTTRATFHTRFPDGAKIYVTLVSVSHTATRVTVRVGSFGGRAQGRMIISKIVNRLEEGEVPQGAAVSPPPPAR